VPPGFFTLDEANSLLPALEPRLHRLMIMRQQLREHQQALGEFRVRASQHGGALPGSRFGQAKMESARLLAEIREGVRPIESWGCLIKDLDHGLVDFLARRGQGQVLLCWCLGEPEIRYWHGLQEDFAGRKPLREDPGE
jgi:hypothetical protein